MMRYLSLDIIDTSDYPYPADIKDVSITLRGTKSIFDIYFSLTDLEYSFNISIPRGYDFTWINTPSGKEKYLTYSTMKRILYQFKDHSNAINQYLSWIDDLLFSVKRNKTQYSYSVSTRSTDEDMFSDLDDSSSISSFQSNPDTEFIVKALRHKLDQMEHQLIIKNKDISILERDVEIRDKEIQLLNLKLSLTPDEHNWI